MGHNASVGQHLTANHAVCSPLVGRALHESGMVVLCAREVPGNDTTNRPVYVVERFV